MGLLSYAIALTERQGAKLKRMNRAPSAGNSISKINNGPTPRRMHDKTMDRERTVNGVAKRVSNWCLFAKALRFIVNEKTSEKVSQLCFSRFQAAEHIQSVHCTNEFSFFLFFFLNIRIHNLGHTRTYKIMHRQISLDKMHTHKKENENNHNLHQTSSEKPSFQHRKKKKIRKKFQRNLIKDTPLRWLIWQICSLPRFLCSQPRNNDDNSENVVASSDGKSNTAKNKKNKKRNNNIKEIMI